MHRPEWTSGPHPLCDMPPAFVLETAAMHGRNGSRLYVAFDGNGDV